MTITKPGPPFNPYGLCDKCDAMGVFEFKGEELCPNCFVEVVSAAPVYNRGRLARAAGIIVFLLILLAIWGFAAMY